MNPSYTKAHFVRVLFLMAVFSILGVGCTMSSVPKYLYKVVRHEVWEESQKVKEIVLGDFDKAFIHLAEEDQVDRIVGKFFADCKSVMVLKLDSQKLTGRLVYESNPGGSSKYWHLYEGSIPLGAVLAASEQSTKS